MSRHRLVHRCPAVSTAAKTAARVTRSGSTSSITIMALFPPDSSNDLPSRLATAVPTFSPMLHDPVAEISGTRRSLMSNSPTVRLGPAARLKTPSNPLPAMTRSAIFVTATAVIGAWLEGFQMTGSPQTAAINAFQLHTVTGKLKAVITPTGHSGCHCSYILWSGRSEAMVRP
jgi:hypothetical protein